ncbi:MAG: response regulator transcription factor [Flavobacterium sp.]|nr:response regulator transcription factor [Flavobacterium sp.]
MDSKKSILIVDDHLVVRKGIELIFEERFKKFTVYSVENYEQTLEILDSLTIDLILLDINIKGTEYITIMSQIKKIQPNVKILIFSSHEEKNFAMRYIKQGADGYLNKFCDEDKFVEAVETIFQKGFYATVEITKDLQIKSKKPFQNTIDSLSNREYEIAKLLLTGLGNLEISNKLSIKMSTVSTYKNRIFSKLDINNVVTLSEIFNKKA